MNYPSFVVCSDRRTYTQADTFRLRSLPDADNQFDYGGYSRPSIMYLPPKIPELYNVRMQARKQISNRYAPLSGGKVMEDSMLSSDKQFGLCYGSCLDLEVDLKLAGEEGKHSENRISELMK